MSPYIARARKQLPTVSCPLPRGWFRRDGALWSCPGCGRVFRLTRNGDFVGNWKTWERVMK